jgi:hypothetical protein
MAKSQTVVIGTHDYNQVKFLKEYLEKNWGVHKKHELHHPEDLISNASTYIEIAYHVLVDFGVAPPKDKK